MWNHQIKYRGKCSFLKNSIKNKKQPKATTFIYPPDSTNAVGRDSAKQLGQVVHAGQAGSEGKHD